MWVCRIDSSTSAQYEELSDLIVETHASSCDNKSSSVKILLTTHLKAGVSQSETVSATIILHLLHEMWCLLISV